VATNRIHYKQVRRPAQLSRRSDCETALRLIESGRVDTASMVTHGFPLSAVNEAVDAVAREKPIKVAALA
jgi:L-iditol 2-dehydrogenase